MYTKISKYNPIYIVCLIRISHLGPRGLYLCATGRTPLINILMLISYNYRYYHRLIVENYYYRITPNNIIFWNKELEMQDCIKKS